MPENLAPSVIIPVLNNPVGLKRCIEAIRNQKIGCELIVVDNGSTDQTLEVARSFADKVLQHPGLTIGEMRNRGAQIAKGSVLVFTDSDQEPSEDWLTSGLRVILGDGRIGMVGARYHAPPGSRWVARTWDLQRRYADVFGEIGWLEAGNLFVNRRAFETVQGFRNDLIASEDVDLSFRVRQAGYRVFCDPQIVNYHHGDPQTLFEFFCKERWRGSSGWKAWISQGYPASELLGLLWPFWVVLGLVTALCFAWVVGWFVGFWQGIGVFASGIFVWIAPAVYRACLVSKRSQGSAVDGIRLTILLLVYGIARFPLPTNRKSELNRMVKRHEPTG